MDISMDEFDALLPGEEDLSKPTPEAEQMNQLDTLQQGSAPLKGRFAEAVAGQAAMIAGVGGAPEEVTRVLMSGDAIGQRTEAANLHYAQQHQAVLDYVNTALQASLIDPVGVANEAVAETQRVEARKVSPASEEMAYMDKAAPFAPGSLRDEQAAQMKALNTLSELGDSQDWIDEAFDVIGMVSIPFAETSNMSDAADLINADASLAMLFGPDLESIAFNFQALSPEVKALVYPRIQELVVEATGKKLFGIGSESNVMQAQQIMQMFLGADVEDQISGSRMLDVALSASMLPGTGIVKQAAQIGKLGAAERVAAGQVLKDAAQDAIRQNNPMNMAKKAGDEASAAQYATSAMTDEAKAAAMNTTKADAAMAGMPTEQHTLFTQVPEGLAAPIAGQIEKDFQIAAGYTASMTTERQMLQVGALKESARKLVVNDFMKHMDKQGEDFLLQNIQLEDLKILDESAEGFTYSYTLRRIDTPPVVPLAEATGEAAADTAAHVVAGAKLVTKTKSGSTLIEGEVSSIQEALSAAGLPLGAVNKVAGKTYVSLSGDLYDQAVAAMNTAAGTHLGVPTATASQAVKGRAAANLAQGAQLNQAAAVVGGASPQQAAQTLLNAQIPQYQKITGTVKFQVNADTGTYEATMESLEKGLFGSHVKSPTAWSKGKLSDGDFLEAVTDSIIASDVGAAAQAATNKFLEWTMAPISGLKNVKARARVDAVLLHGDTYVNAGTAIKGRTFTPQELVAGFNIPGHKGLVRLSSPAEVTAYYRARMFADSMYQVENHAMRRRLELEGMMNVKVAGNDVIASPFETWQAAKAGLASKEGHVIYDAANNVIKAVNPAEMENLYKQGYRLVRSRKAYNTSGGGTGNPVSAHTNYILVRPTDISSLPANVLHFKPGYVPKMNKVEYMVKMVTRINHPGQPGASTSNAIRGFVSKKDAELFRDEQVAQYIAAHPNTSYEDALDIFRIGGAEELTGIDRIEAGLTGNGGLYTGARSQNDILFGLSGQEMARVGALEAFQRQASHVGTLVSRNELRMVQEQRWINTVRKTMPEVNITGFESTALPPGSKGAALDRMRNQIREWNGIPEAQESMMQAATQYLHDWVLSGTRKLGFQAEGSWQSLQWLKHTNPITAVKATMMHTLLGFMTPVQLYVQASAALIAGARRAGVSLTGDIAGDLRAAFIFGQLDNIRSGTALGKVLGKMGAAGHIDQRVVDAYDAFRKTGLYESAMNNADTAKLATDGLGVTSSMLRKADTVSLLFYRSGELFNRRYSFIKEYATWAAANPGKKATQADIIAITKEANKDMLELNAANRATWQGGSGTGMLRQIAGMATQFMQVSTKTAELLLPGVFTGRAASTGFTQAQKGRIFFSQMALFGAAGVPLGNAALNNGLNILGVDSVEPSTALALNQGFIGYAVNGMLGDTSDPTQQLDVSQRVALGNQINEFVQSILTADDPLIYAMLGPAGGGVGSRFLDAMRDLNIFYLGSKAGTRDLTGEDIVAGIHTLGLGTATGNNLYKAYVMHNLHKILDRRRNTVDERNYNFTTEMAVAFGLRPSIETTTRSMQLGIKEHEELVKQFADTHVRLLHRAVFELRFDPEKIAEIDKALCMQSELLDNPQLCLEVSNQVQRRIFGTEQKSAHDTALAEWWKIVAIDRLTEGYRADVGFGSQQAITQPFVPGKINDVMESK